MKFLILTTAIIILYEIRKENLDAHKLPVVRRVNCNLHLKVSSIFSYDHPHWLSISFTIYLPVVITFLPNVDTCLVMVNIAHKLRETDWHSFTSFLKRSKLDDLLNSPGFYNYSIIHSRNFLFIRLCLSVNSNKYCKCHTYFFILKVNK